MLASDQPARTSKGAVGVGGGRKAWGSEEYSPFPWLEEPSDAVVLRSFEFMTIGFGVSS